MRNWFYTNEEWERTASLWFLVVILAGFLFALSLDPTHNRDDYKTCKAEADSIYELRITALSEPYDPESNAKKQQNKGNHEQEYFENRATCNDLDAQWSMAVVTYIAFCLGALGILLVYRTLNATRETIRVTRKASNDQLTALKKSTRLEMQPYLSCESIRMRRNTFISQGGWMTVAGIISVKNNGKIPAYIECIENRARGVLLASESAEKVKTPTFDIKINRYIAPNETVPFHVIFDFRFETFKGDKLELSNLIINGGFRVCFWDDFTDRKSNRRVYFDFISPDTMGSQAGEYVEFEIRRTIVERDEIVDEREQSQG